MVSAVSLSAFETDLAVGQLIFDINGEYSADISRSCW